MGSSVQRRGTGSSVGTNPTLTVRETCPPARPHAGRERSKREAVLRACIRSQHIMMKPRETALSREDGSGTLLLPTVHLYLRALNTNFVSFPGGLAGSPSSNHHPLAAGVVPSSNSDTVLMWKHAFRVSDPAAWVALRSRDGWCVRLHIGSATHPRVPPRLSLLVLHLPRRSSSEVGWATTRFSSILVTAVLLIST